MKTRRQKSISVTRFITVAVLGLVNGLAGLNSQAQSYAIDWFAIAGGGGMSTGGEYSVRGSIGQPDAGVLAGGDFVIEGGFWSILGVIQTPGAPVLSTERIGNSVRIFWPLPATGFVLECSPTAGTGAVWTQVSFPYTTNTTAISHTVTSPADSRFYRLRK